MSGAQFGLALSVFLACSVEAVEALTIVLAVGVTRDWRSALTGVGVALIVLAALSAGLGPALTALPIDVLRVAVGGLLLVFGLQWLRKAVLRASGLKALHDETSAYARERAAAEAAVTGAGSIDGYAFTIAFKGTLLEGLEVVFIVLTFGANQHDVAARGGCGGDRGARGRRRRRRRARAARPRPRERVEVRGRRDARLVRNVLGRGGRGRALAGRRRGAARAHPRHARGRARHGGGTAAAGAAGSGELMTRLRGAWLAIWDFVVGDDWRLALGVVVALGVTALVAGAGATAWWIIPVVIAALLVISLWRAAR